MNERKSIKIEPTTWEILRMIKGRDETYSAAIDKLIREKITNG